MGDETGGDWRLQCVKVLSATNEALEAENKRLRNEVELLRAEVAALKAPVAAPISLQSTQSTSSTSTSSSSAPPPTPTATSTATNTNTTTNVNTNTCTLTATTSTATQYVHTSSGGRRTKSKEKDKVIQTPSPTSKTITDYFSVSTSRPLTKLVADHAPPLQPQSQHHQPQSDQKEQVVADSDDDVFQPLPTRTNKKRMSLSLSHQKLKKSRPSASSSSSTSTVTASTTITKSITPPPPPASSSSYSSIIPNQAPPPPPTLPGTHTVLSYQHCRVTLPDKATTHDFYWQNGYFHCFCTYYWAEPDTFLSHVRTCRTAQHKILPSLYPHPSTLNDGDGSASGELKRKRSMRRSGGGGVVDIPSTPSASGTVLSNNRNGVDRGSYRCSGSGGGSEKDITTCPTCGKVYKYRKSFDTHVRGCVLKRGESDDDVGGGEGEGEEEVEEAENEENEEVFVKEDDAEGQDDESDGIKEENSEEDEEQEEEGEEHVCDEECGCDDMDHDHLVDQTKSRKEKERMKVNEVGGEMLRSFKIVCSIMPNFINLEESEQQAVCVGIKLFLNNAITSNSALLEFCVKGCEERKSAGENMFPLVPKSISEEFREWLRTELLRVFPEYMPHE